HRGNDVLICREGGGYQSGLLPESRGGELLDEVDAHAARQEKEHGIRRRCADLREFSGVVELAQARVHLVDGGAGVGALETRDQVLARWIVGRDQEDFFETFVRRVLSGCLRGTLVLPGHAEEPRTALCTGKQ